MEETTNIFLKTDMKQNDFNVLTCR